MIIEGILNLVKSLLLFLVGLLPELPTFEVQNSYLTDLANVIGYANRFCHLGVVVGCCGILIAVYNIKAIWSIIMWVVRKIPGVS